MVFFKLNIVSDSSECVEYVIKAFVQQDR